MTARPSLGLAAMLAVWSLTFPPLGHANPIAAENQLTGTTEWRIAEHRRATATDWMLRDQSTTEIEGYASKTSVGLGQTIDLYVNTLPGTVYAIEIFRLGWYEGLGGRSMLGPVYRASVAQPRCEQDPTTLMTHCPWRDPFRLTVPDDWVSGFYLAKLTSLALGKENYVIFVVRNDTREADYLFVSGVNTYQAYNQYGGHSMYPRSREESEGVVVRRAKATHVSFDRPYDRCVHADCDGRLTGKMLGTGEFFRWEASMVRYLEREQLDVAYATNVDAHRSRAALSRHRALLSVGHDEYWSWEMRENFEWARDQCIGIGFFSANSVYWQVRYAPGPSGAPQRTLIGYRNSAFDDDPFARDDNELNDRLITGLWRQALEPHRPARFEDALMGVAYAFWPVNDDLIITEPTHPLFAGVTSTVLPGLVGYEADRMWGNAPPGTVRLGRSPVAPSEPVRSPHMSCQAPDRCESEMTLYQWRGGPYVFAGGTIQWSWGLDAMDSAVRNSRAITIADENVQQITHNVLSLLRQSTCRINISIPPPPRTGTTAPIGAFANVQDGGSIRIVECGGDRCLRIERPFTPSYPSAHIFDRSEMFEGQDLPPDHPEPPDHMLVGPTYQVASDASIRGPVWLTLAYDDERVPIPASRRGDLQMLYLATEDPDQPDSARRWQVVRVGHDPQRRVIQGQLPDFGTASLALGPLSIDIDILPGDPNNTIQQDATAVIPLLIPGSVSFDPASIRTSTMTVKVQALNIVAQASPSGCTVEDFNADGLRDLVCELRNVTSRATQPGQAEVVMRARTADQLLLEAREPITVVPTIKEEF